MPEAALYVDDVMCVTGIVGLYVLFVDYCLYLYDYLKSDCSFPLSPLFVIDRIFHHLLDPLRRRRCYM
jgi:hypothetical protein